MLSQVYNRPGCEILLRWTARGCAIAIKTTSRIPAIFAAMDKQQADLLADSLAIIEAHLFDALSVSAIADAAGQSFAEHAAEPVTRL